ncbi:Monohem cytochrome C protein [Croceitalea dokdonensis DOKDO 023]|uniref:Monohem cytochrome C protein n=1 Tax=Croceitalea dokdonensis DOKDO 023 TaxID=1300341 RepID=A0A0N8H4D8_9FLAO|nr:hypothetical protein [Croceitalea dokdonensis]KPM33092.1 Monohem cytochrome C protein [Croceitalea dokdonensis DOKDO 023]
MKTTYKIMAVVFGLFIYLSCDDTDSGAANVLVSTEDFTINAPVVVQELDTLGFLRGNSSEGEVTYSLISQTPQNSVTLGIRFGEIIVSNPEVFNSPGVNEVNLEVEVRKQNSFQISKVTILRNLNDPDGDGIENSNDSAPDDPCLPLQDVSYTGFNPFNTAWRAADCDSDGISNFDEFSNDTNPYLNESLIGDADGDGVRDDEDVDPNNPCIPEQFQGYVGFDSENEIWATADCDGDGIPNADELANGDSPYPQPDLPCNEILNFELENFEMELRTVDSNNGEGVTIGVIGEECGTFIFTGGSIFNQGCFNEDVQIPFFFEPNAPDSSNGTVTVNATTYSCLSEDGTTSTNFTVEGFGTYSGSASTVELTYTITTEENETISGTLIIRPLD